MPMQVRREVLLGLREHYSARDWHEDRIAFFADRVGT